MRILWLVIPTGRRHYERRSNATKVLTVFELRRWYYNKLVFP
jgi:hypothetical protein